MSFWGYRVSAKLVTTGVVVMLLGAFAVALVQPPVREITLVSRGMAFYAEDGDTPNPTLNVKAGERVRIVLRNQDRGIQHDFAVPAFRTALDPVDWDDSGDVTFDVPGTPGIFEYRCRPHMLMMRGRIVVHE